MIEALKTLLKRHWPALHLRTILLAMLFFAAAMPGLTAIFLRVYENTLVRQTEAELVAQSAALAASARVFWPGAPETDTPALKREPGYYRPELTTIDLSSSPVLPEREPARVATQPADPAAAATATLLTPVFDRTSQTTLASIILLDRNGREVFGPDVGRSLAHLPEVKSALADDPSTVLRRNGAYQQRYAFEWLSRASAIRLHHARPIRVGDRVVGALLVSRSPRALFRGIYEDKGKIALGVAGIFGLLVVLAGLVSRGVTRPIEGLSAASREVAAGRGTVPETPQTAAIEIRQLYEDFRHMAQAIDRRSQYLRDFAAAVSHEFKTPLAGIGGAVELLQDHGETMSPAERERFLANIAADKDRLNQLVTRLLELARADMARPEAGVAEDVVRPARRVADALGGRGLTIDLHLPSDLPRVAAPEATVETVLTILVENARQAGATSVRIEARDTSDQLVLAVTDNGPGVAEADRERLFEPFFTSRRAQGGTGLGLAIARSLLAASDGAITLAPSTGGARFEVVLPRADVA
ncbi:sensor histidine kinase [Caulobacter mirabilis]|uniref:histidine kinase n=1 Tax=Caulobacter mirabilis TaxID=69666 RepID=A0A2D2AZ37_9CAUL|nr:HAMP domain-containing sensor histidine kinase [Caulobacter mirabilis]ATQ43197.1 two-component sensor histidine kinase [Caulobacter mirabilis]